MTQTEFYAILREPIGAILAAHPGPEGPALVLAFLAAAVALVIGLGLTLPIALVAGVIDSIANLGRWLVSPRKPGPDGRSERATAAAMPARAEPRDLLGAPALPSTAGPEPIAAAGAARPLSAWTAGGPPLGATATALRAEPIAREEPPVVHRPAPALHLVALIEPSALRPPAAAPDSPVAGRAEPRLAGAAIAALALARRSGRVAARTAAVAGRVVSRALVAARSGLAPALAHLGPALGRGARAVGRPLRDLLPFGWHQGRFVRYRRDRTGRRYYYSRRRHDPQHRRSRPYTS